MHNRRVPPGSWRLVLVPVLWLLLLGCGMRSEERTLHDEFRSSCTAAARWHGLAGEQAAAGQMAPATFAAIDDAYDQVTATCRRVLLGEAPLTAADQAAVADFTARQGETR